MLGTYGVGRGTLREALRCLEMQGVVTIKTGPGGGPVVNEPSWQPLTKHPRANASTGANPVSRCPGGATGARTGSG